MPNSLRQIISAPEFQNFSDEEKMTVIARVAPDFGSLSPQDRVGALQKMGVRLNGPSAANQARQRLESREGMTPERIKENAAAGLSITPENRRSASASEEARAFGVNAVTGALGSLASIPALAGDAMLDAIPGSRGLTEAPSMPLTRAVGDARRATADWAKELVGVPPEAITDASDAFGNTTGEIAATFAKVPDALRRGLGAVAEMGAVKRYTKALAPSKANAKLAEETVPKLIERGEWFTDPKNLARKADEAADAVDVDSAVLHMPNAARSKPVLSEIQAQRDALYNVLERHPAPADPKPLIDAIKAKRPTAQVFERNGEIIVREIRHPSMQAKSDRLHELERHIQDSANRGMFKNETANNLRKDYDYYSDPEAGRFADIDPVRRPADSHVADAMRTQLNSDPGVAAANAEKSFQLDTKKLMDAAPTPKPIVTWTQGITGGVAGLLGGPAAGGTLAAGGMLYRFLQSPGFRTASAVAQKRVGDLIRAGQIKEAEALAGAMAQEHEQNAYLQRLMTGGQ